jgi:hypothetical protein
MQIRILPLNLCLDVPPTIRHAQVATSSKSRDIILEIVSGGTSVISLFDPSDEKARGRLDLYDLCLSTSCRKRGWKRLRLQSDEIRRVHSRFRAYWLAVRSTSLRFRRADNYVRALQGNQIPSFATRYPLQQTSWLIYLMIPSLAISLFPEHTSLARFTDVGVEPPERLEYELIIRVASSHLAMSTTFYPY